MDLSSVLNNQSMENLISRTGEDWKSIEENLASTVRTGIPTLDNIIYGFQNEMAGIIGSSGTRKTTLLTNILNFNGVSKKVVNRIPQVYITVEAGMRPERLRDMWLAMRTTQYLRHWKKIGKLPHGTSDFIFTDFFKFHEANETQKNAIDLAKADLAKTPTWILGSGDFGGVENIENYGEIFKTIYENIGYCVVYIDHLHAIYSSKKSSDYEHVILVTNEIANLMKKYGFTVVMVGQVSLASSRINSLETRGGTRFREECGTYLSVKYNRNLNVQTLGNHSLEITIEKSRKSADFIKMEVEMEPNSGLIVTDGVITQGEINEAPQSFMDFNGESSNPAELYEGGLRLF